MDSFIPLFRGGKPREVMEIWFTGPHCLFSTHINYNQNQETLRLPFLMSSYTFRFFVCVCVFPCVQYVFYGVLCFQITMTV